MPSVFNGQRRRARQLPAMGPSRPVCQDYIAHPLRSPANGCYVKTLNVVIALATLE